MRPPSSPGTQSGLRDFVLGYCRQAGAIVEPPAYGVSDVLLPEEVAARLGIAPFQRFAFEEPSDQETGSFVPDQVTSLYYGHPLMERIAEEVRQQTGNARLYINAVRVDKRGLAALASKAFTFPNARLFPVPKAEERAALYHYVRFNFKADLVADEKRELILPVYMHVQGGYALEEEESEQIIHLESTPGFAELPESPPSWRPAEAPLSRPALAELLERARQAALERLAAPLEMLHQRVHRFLELDRARLEQYYHDLRGDLERRLQGAGDERRDTLKEKMAAVEAERQAKLADAEEKYRVRVTLGLVNLLLVVQPKVILPMQIKNRTTTSTRLVVWDPLLHRLEPLACDFCGRPSFSLWLCTRGHLAHSDCRLPQCVDCKRVYCRLCAEEMTTCAVCARPLCLHSMNRCPTCGRGTCREHVGLCHAASGEPLRILPTVPPPSEAKPEPVQAALESVQATPEPAPKPKKPKPRPTSASKTAPVRAQERKEGVGAKAGRAAPGGWVSGKTALTAQEIEVYAEMERPLITAYVIAYRRTVAVRTWELVEEGIGVLCQCEKRGPCPADGLLLRPAPVEQIEAQLAEEIRRLREEYGVPAQRLKVYRVVHGRPQFERRLTLFGRWKDREALASAQSAFDRAE